VGVEGDAPAWKERAAERGAVDCELKGAQTLSLGELSSLLTVRTLGRTGICESSSLFATVQTQRQRRNTQEDRRRREKGQSYCRQGREQRRLHRSCRRTNRNSGRLHNATGVATGVASEAQKVAAGVTTAITPLAWNLCRCGHKKSNGMTMLGSSYVRL
jgi:hypothetical protein